MGFLIGLALVAFALLLAKHLVLHTNNHMLKIKHEALETEYNTVHRIALQLQSQNKTLTERNNVLKALSNSGGSGDSLQAKLVKELIVFCHPDKHGGSEKASRLTQQLIKVRDSK